MDNSLFGMPHALTPICSILCATIAVAEAGAVANQEERKKKNKKKYAYLGPGHTPIAIESSGVFGTEAIKFLKDLSHHLKLASGEKVLLIN